MKITYKDGIIEFNKNGKWNFYSGSGHSAGGFSFENTAELIKMLHNDLVKLEKDKAYIKKMILDIKKFRKIIN